MMFDPIEVFEGAHGETTKAFYAFMDGLGVEGKLATALFRAQKRSSAAKRYGGHYRRAAYDVKNWSLGEVCRIAALCPNLVWGWKRDPKTPGYEWVLYVELPYGQVSFHAADRLDGPDFRGEWDGARHSRERILKFCAELIVSSQQPREESANAST